MGCGADVAEYSENVPVLRRALGVAVFMLENKTVLQNPKKV
jgi:hypothetical protein